MYRGNTQKGRNEDSEEWIDVGGLLASLDHSKLVRSSWWEVCLPSVTMVMSRPGCCQEPYLGLWSYNNKGLC